MKRIQVDLFWIESSGHNGEIYTLTKLKYLNPHNYWPISSKLETKHHWMKGIHVCSNETLRKKSTNKEDKHAPFPIWPDQSPRPSRASDFNIFFWPYNWCCIDASWSFWIVSSPFHPPYISPHTSARQLSQRNGTRLPESTVLRRVLFPVSWKRKIYTQELYSVIQSSAPFV